MPPTKGNSTPPSESESVELPGTSQSFCRHRNGSGGSIQLSTTGSTLTNYFHMFRHKDIKALKAAFCNYDTDKDGSINLVELKLLLENLGCAQTHIRLKQIMATMDDKPSVDKINFHQFLGIYREACPSNIPVELPKEISVEEVGVRGAVSFFQAIIEAHRSDIKLLEDQRQEQEAVRQKRAEVMARRKEFLEKLKKFQ